MSELAWKRIIIALTVTSLVTSLIFAGLTLSPETQSLLQNYSEQSPEFIPLIIIITHTLGNVIAPTSSFFISVFSIPYIGWFAAASYSSVGNMIGYVVAFFIARRFRTKITKLFTTLQKMNSWQTQISKQEEFWGFFILRISAQPINDYVSYLSGITAIKFSTFFAATLLYELIIQYSRTYLISLGFRIHPIYFTLGTLPFIIGYLVYKWYTHKNKLKDLT